MKEIAENLIQGEISKVKELTETALSEGISAREILNQGLLCGMDIVGQKFKADEMFLPEVMASAQAMSAAMEVLEPELTKAGEEPVAKVLLGTVQGDIHYIGKNLVGMMLRGAGFKVIDIGEDVTPEKFIDAIRQEDAKVVGMSALLTTTMESMKTTVETIEGAGLRNEIKIIVGGAVVTEDFADTIGADGYAPDALVAVDVIKKLLSIG